MSRQEEKSRPNAHRRGYSHVWRKARLGYLSHHPLCKHCERDEVVEEATVVDHIIPHRGDKQLFWDKTNWQPLCKRCHDHKTATEDGGFTGWH
ncbi:MAG: HNH endonuclease signature motif containing protein [Bermanella sp.]